MWGDNMYSIEAVVRYSELNNNKEVSMSQIANYFQNCTLCHSEDIHMGFDYLEECHRAWFLTGWQIEVSRVPVFNEKITIRTWPYDFNGVYGYRNFDIIDEAGNCIAWANSIWFYLDTLTLKPLRATPEDIAAYTLEDRIEMHYENRKIETIGEPIILEPFKIRKAYIDSNSHVNNTKYIEFAEEYLPDDFQEFMVRADYRRATQVDELLHPRIYKYDNRFIVEFCGTDNHTNVIVEFRQRKQEEL